MRFFTEKIFGKNTENNQEKSRASASVAEEDPWKKYADSLIMMILPACPYCRSANRMIEELCEEYPEYRKINIVRINELTERKFAKSLDYYYVPSFFMNGKKLFEGAPGKEDIRIVLNEAAEQLKLQII